MKLSYVLIAVGIYMCNSSANSVFAGCACNTNVDNNGTLNFLDYAITYDCARLNNCAGCLAPDGCDVNCDGTVNFADVAAVHWDFLALPGDACNQPLGACEPTLPGNHPSCIDTTEQHCEDANITAGTFHGDLSMCSNGQPIDIPTLSEWGLVVLSLALLAGATLVLRSRPLATAGP